MLVNAKILDLKGGSKVGKIYFVFQVPYVRVAHGSPLFPCFLQFLDVLDDVVFGQERSRNVPPKKHVVIRMDARPVSGSLKSDSQSRIDKMVTEPPFASGIRRGCPCQRGVGAWT